MLRAWWLLLMLSLCASASLARAQAARPLRVLLRVKQSQDAELLTRLRGQTSDLPVVLEDLAAEIAGVEAAGARAALALCAERGADALIWAEWPEAGEPSVWIALATCHDRRLFARQVTLDASASATSTSGITEACALMLRGALSVLSQGGSIGVHAESEEQATQRSVKAPAPNTTAPAASAVGSASVAQPEPEPEPEAPPPQTPPVVESTRGAAPGPRESAPAQRQPSRLVSYGALAVQEAWDGASARGQPSIQVSLALGGATHQLGLTGQVGLPVELRDAFTRVVLARHGIAAGWWVNAWRHGALRLRWSFAAGVAMYQRSVQARSAQVRPRASHLAFAPLLGTTLELQRALGPVWLSLGAGVDAVLRIPRFAYQTESGPRDALTLWPLVPRLFVALAWESP